MTDERIQRGAVAAAAVMALAVTYFMIEKNRKCSTFPDVWENPGAVGGLYLKNSVIDDAEHWVGATLRSIILAQETPNRAKLLDGLAGYIADCDWDKSRKSKKGRQVWDSLSQVVNGMLNKYNADPSGFLKG